MPIGRFEYDPQQDGWIDPAAPELPARSLAEITDNRFTTRGTQVFYQQLAGDQYEIRQYVGQVGYAAGSSIVVARDGGVYLTNLKPRYELDQESGNSMWFQGVVTGDVELPDGTRIPIANERVTLAPEGELVYVRTVGAGAGQDFARPGDARLSAGGWRPATPSELLDRGRIGYLVKNFADQLRAFGNSADGQAEGLSGRDLYGVARWVAARIDIRGALTTDLTARVGL